MWEMQAQSVARFSAFSLDNWPAEQAFHSFGCGHSLFDSTARNRDGLRELRLSHSEALRILSFSRPAIQVFFNSAILQQYGEVPGDTHQERGLHLRILEGGLVTRA